MTISAVADSAGSPPKVDVTVAVTPGAVMSSVSLWRNDSSGRSLVRTQPSPGFDSRTVTDYECPYGEPVTYEWEGIYSGTFSTVWNETWANLSAWSLRFGSAWSVSGGKALNVGADSGISRTVTPGRHRIEFSGWTVSSGIGWVLIRSANEENIVTLSLSGTTLSVLGVGLLLKPTTIDASQSFHVDMGAATATIQGTGGSYVVSTIPDDAVEIMLVSGSAPAFGYSMDDIHVRSYDAPTDIAETSDPVQLDPDNAWLVHPATPTASFPLNRDNGDEAGIVAIGPVDNGSASTLHRILGTRTPIATTTGPRYNDQTSMTIALTNADERDSMRGLLASDTPILIQIPPSWDIGFNCGFYHVGDTTTTRLETSDDHRRITLPLTKVQPPVVDVDGGDWTYANVAVEFDTYYELATTFDTYADLAADVRA